MILDKVMQTQLLNREFFDPLNKKHIEEFKYFLQNRKWRISCPFILEEPWISIPDMLKDRLVRHTLGVTGPLA